MEQFLKRTDDDLVLDTDGLRHDLAQMLKKVNTISELAWLREQWDMITIIEFGRKFSDVFLLSGKETITSDVNDALAYTE